jgi:Spy/CpxP family protein refolding chaperone
MLLILALVSGTTLTQAQVNTGSKGSTVSPTQPESGRKKSGGEVNQSTEQPANTKPGATKAQQEPVEDLTKLTTADQCRQYAEAKVTWLEGQVGVLTTTQKRSIQDIFNQTYLEIKGVKESNPDMPRGELKAKAEDMLSGARTKSLEVLTPEQRASLDSWQSGRQPGMQDQAKQRALEQTEELDKVVGLSADQKQRVLDLNTQLWMEGRDWKQANPDATAEAKKAYAKEMALKRMEGYKGILTEEQKTKFMEYRNDNPKSME